MKFAFNLIQNPLLDENNRDKVVGTMPNGMSVSVARRLDGWKIRLVIVVDGVTWHDSDVMPDEIHQVNILRESAMANKSIQQDAHRAKVYDVAKSLTPGMNA